MEKYILLLLGLNLHKGEDGNLDFDYTLGLLKKSIEILRKLFNHQASIGNIHQKYV
jgi:hypothetical protein